MHFHGLPKKLCNFVYLECLTKQRYYILFIVVPLVLLLLSSGIHSIVFQAAKSQLPKSKTSLDTIKNDYLTYSNSKVGVKIQYPRNWSVQEVETVLGANNTIAIFTAPSKTGSQLGNISGVSGNFVPYLDIFVFDSKNMSLDQIIKGRMNYFHNNTDFVLNQAKPVILKTTRSAYLLDYNVTVGGEEHFRKLQIFTLGGNRIYVITFTSQQELFSRFMPLVQKMINSFEVFHNKLSTIPHNPSTTSSYSKQSTTTSKNVSSEQTSHPNIPLIPPR